MKPYLGLAGLLYIGFNRAGGEGDFFSRFIYGETRSS
jgi:hypothetical protein